MLCGFAHNRKTMKKKNVTGVTGRDGFRAFFIINLF